MSKSVSEQRGTHNTLRTVAAFFIAPLVASLCLAVASAVGKGLAQFSVVEVLLWSFVLYFYAMCATLILGLPSFLLLRRMGAVRWWSAVLVGAVIGILVLAFIDPRGVLVFTSDGQISTLWSGIGAVSAFVFWLISNTGRAAPAKLLSPHNGTK